MAGRSFFPGNRKEKLSVFTESGNTLQTVTDLDNGLLQGFVYQNEFNMGYEGIQTLVDKEKKGYFTEQVNIKYKLVTQDTLYESDNERLLFLSI